MLQPPAGRSLVQKGLENRTSGYAFLPLGAFAALWSGRVRGCSGSVGGCLNPLDRQAEEVKYEARERRPYL